MNKPWQIYALRDMPDDGAAEAGRQMVEFLWSSEECCDSCAYRAGTIPNQCAGTIMDALGCAASGEPFYCHNTGQICEGWKATQKKKPAKENPCVAP